MSENEEHNGRCRCGAIQYRASGHPVMVEYCHCQSCRRSSGSVVGALAGFHKEGFDISSGTPAWYEANPGVRRGFCGTCGSPLFYENKAYPEEVYISLGSFCKPEDLPPDRHVWFSERVTWYQTEDRLPKHDAFSGTDSVNGVAAPYRRPQDD
jgi:hypothetical protein